LNQGVSQAAVIIIIKDEHNTHMWRAGVGAAKRDAPAISLIGCINITATIILIASVFVAVHLPLAFSEPTLRFLHSIPATFIEIGTFNFILVSILN